MSVPDIYAQYEPGANPASLPKADFPGTPEAEAQRTRKRETRVTRRQAQAPAPDNIQQLVANTAREMGVDPAFAHRIAQQESDFNPHAVSKAGAQGVMQLMPGTAKELGVADPFNPVENVHGGVKYLKQLLDQFHGNKALAAAAYNAGPGAVSAWLSKHGALPTETINYVKSVVGDDLNKPIIERASAQEAPDIYAKGAPVPDIYAAKTAPKATYQPPSPGPVGNFVKYATGALNTVAGHQDLPFILWNAYQRDQDQGRAHGALGGNVPDPAEFVRLIRDPKSTVHQAWALYSRDPAAAMDEYGMGSPAQEQYEAKHGHGMVKAWDQAKLKAPWLNGIDTFVTELGNPMALAEGGPMGKALDWLNDTLKIGERVGQPIAKALKLGTPFAKIAERAGDKGVSWTNSLLHEIMDPETFLNEDATTQNILHQLFPKPEERFMARTSQQVRKVFEGLSTDEQKEVVALSQGQKPNPKFFRQYNELKQRADELKRDITKITALKLHHGLLKPNQVHGTYFPMKNSYEFTPRATIENELKKKAGAGIGRTENKEKVYQNIRESEASGQLAKDFLPANNYANWRRAQMQRIGFEHALGRAPSELKLPANKGLRKALVANNGMIGGLKYDFAENPMKYASPQMRRGAIAPELVDFMFNNDRLRKYLTSGNPVAPGEGSDFARKLIALSRNMIITLPFYHPIRNVAVNDAAARGLHGLPKSPEAMGFITQTARATAMQAGVPSKMIPGFIHGTRQYAKWLDRALKAGATGAFGEPAKSALGGERARVLTEPAPGMKGWLRRLDKAFTQYGEFNRERVFGEPGEQRFAVELFKDAVTKGHMSDEQAGAVVRQAYHDYFNLDPNSPWSYVDLFMPWRKSNTKFWVNVLTRKPQYVTSVTHAIRNYNEQTAPDEMTGPYARNPFQVLKAPGGIPETLSFPGRDLANVANAVGSAAQGQMGEAGGDVWNLATGSANPLFRLGERGYDTAQNRFSPGVSGPETDPDMLFNTKAPGNVQTMQLIRNVAGTLIPVPIVGFVARDIARRGITNGDATRALMMLSTTGYGGQQRLTQQQRYLVSAAKRNYKRAYDTYKYHTHDDAALKQAWDIYMGALQNAGVIGQ